MRTFLLYFFFGLLTLAVPNQVLGANNLSSVSAVERNKKMEKEHAGIIKILKKEYGAKVTIEKWKDGNHYYILKKKRNFARIDMNGNLISFIDGTGQKQSFFQKCELQKLSNGEYVTKLMLPSPARNWTFAWSSGKIYTGSADWAYINNGGKMLVRLSYGTGAAKKYELYSLDGRKLIDRQLDFLTIYRSYSNFIDAYGVKCKVDVGLTYLHCGSRDASGKLRTAIVMEDIPINVPGKTLPGGILYTDNWEVNSSVQAQVIKHLTFEGECLQQDSVTRIILDKPTTVYRWLTDEKIADSVVSVTYLPGTSYTLYECGDSHSPFNRLGFIDQSLYGKSSPCIFSDIYVAKTGELMVKVNVDDEFQPYNSDHTYIPDTINTFANLQQKFVDEEPLSVKQQRIYLGYVAQSLAHDITIQEQIHAMIKNDRQYKKFQNYPLAHMNFKVTDKVITFDLAKVLEYYKPLVDKCFQSKSVLATSVSKLHMEFYGNFNKISKAYVELRQEKARKLAAQQEKQRQEQARRERIARLDNFRQQLNQAQAIVNSGSTYRPNNSNNKTVGVKNVNSSTQAKSKPARVDNSGRKAFLRGEIANWRNKLAKAENSLKQALSSGEDTWQKKRVIESKRKTVDECLQMIRQYEAELNSLK